MDIVEIVHFAKCNIRQKENQVTLRSSYTGVTLRDAFLTQGENRPTATPYCIMALLAVLVSKTEFV